MKGFVTNSSTNLRQVCLTGVMPGLLLLCLFFSASTFLKKKAESSRGYVEISAITEYWERDFDLESVTILNRKIETYRSLLDNILDIGPFSIRIHNPSSLPNTFSYNNGLGLFQISSGDYPSCNHTFLVFTLLDHSPTMNCLDTGRTNVLISKSQKFIQNMNHNGPPNSEHT